MECFEKISVIVPAYNIASYLPRCLDSILRQIHTDLEIIVVDDGSTDHTQALLCEYAKKDPRIVPVHQDNQGVTAARLYGVSLSSGNWIGFVDGDDAIEPDMYAFLLENAKKYNAGISHCGYQMQFPDGRIHYFHNTGEIHHLDTESGLLALLSGTKVEPGLCNKLFRRDLFSPLLAAGAMNSSIRINEDLLMNYYLFSQAEHTVFEDACKYHYIVRSSSASRQKPNKHRIYDPIKVRQIIRNTAPPALARIAHSAYIGTCIDVYGTTVCAGAKEYREDLRNLRGLLRAEKDHFNLLSRFRRWKAWMILYTPHVYGVLYRYYCVHIQNSPYQ